MKEVISIPNAQRTFEALRSLGYDLFSSIADVVDNAITPKVGARNIRVHFSFNEDYQIVCRVQDDGCGMEQHELEEAMRLGTESSYEDNDLGKFGMGMKTASLSHCDILTVLSKTRNSGICGYRWDISKIQESQKWTLLQLDEVEIRAILKSEGLKLGDQGTVILWDEMSGINRNYSSYTSSKLAQNYYFRLVTNLRLHLGMTYHRFLDGTLSEENSIKIFVNEDVLVPWDPFCQSEPEAEQVELNNGLSMLQIAEFETPVRIAGFTLPNKEGFSSEEAWKKAKGLLSWNDSQGYYIYRANRLIRHGGWHSTKAKDEHDKLARVSIDIDPSLDELFRITVNKTKVHFPELLFQHLKAKVNPKIIRKAKSKYNRSDDSLKVNNTFRRRAEKVGEVSKGLLDENHIGTKSSNSGDDVEVSNPTGTWLANKISEFQKYGSTQDYEVISDHLPDGQLWKIICSDEDKFKIVVNASHPFYTKIYQNSTNKSTTNTLDALLFSLAFAELYNRTDQNAQLFESFKAVCSNTLERLIQEEII